MYQYLVIIENEPFYTHWFDAENNFNNEVNMIVIDFHKNVYTDDGINWKEITEDHL